jgi:hypothetical protein
MSKNAHFVAHHVGRARARHGFDNLGVLKCVELHMISKIKKASVMQIKFNPTAREERTQRQQKNNIEGRAIRWKKTKESHTIQLKK